MGRGRTSTIAATPGWALDAAVHVAGLMGLTVASDDRRAGSLLLRQSLANGRSSRMLSVSVTDNGRGGSTALVNWTREPGVLAAPGAAATLRRFCSRLRIEAGIGR